jgi:hypothetical protein
MRGSVSLAVSPPGLVLRQGAPGRRRSSGTTPLQGHPRMIRRTCMQESILRLKALIGWPWVALNLYIIAKNVIKLLG